jgi:hypothetical protein
MDNVGKKGFVWDKTSQIRDTRYFVVCFSQFAGHCVYVPHSVVILPHKTIGISCTMQYMYFPVQNRNEAHVVSY